MSTGESKRRVALITMASVPKDIDANARKIENWMIKASQAGAQLAVFPEMALIGNCPGAYEAAFPATAPVFERLANAAENLQLAASMGFFELDADKRYVAQAFLHEGKLKSVYRKVFCCEAGGNDGDRFQVVDWDGVKVGTLICWDLHFPLVAREQARRGARLILHPSAYHNDVTAPFDNENHNVFLPRARAWENGVYFLHVNASGPAAPENAAFFGNVCAVGPEGEILARIDRAPYSENMVIVDLDLSATDTCRTREWLEREHVRLPLIEEVPPGR